MLDGDMHIAEASIDATTLVDRAAAGGRVDEIDGARAGLAGGGAGEPDPGAPRERRLARSVAPFADLRGPCWSWTTQLAMIQAAGVMPLPHPQRPLTR